MTALAPASRTRAPEPHQHRPHAPGHPRIHSQMRLSDAPARGFHQAQPAQCCRPRPVQSHSPTKIRCNNNSNSAVYSGQRFSWRTNHSALELLFQLVAVASSLRSFHKFFHHPPTIPDSNLGSHTVSTHRSTSAVTRQHQCALAV